MKIGIYTRISFDDDVRTKRQGVERQERMCRELADARGWHVIDVYVDNNVSAGASSNTHRPEYDRMLVDLASGSIDRILVVSQDRLLRRPEQLETLFRLHDRLGIPQIECVSSGPIDVMTASGRAFARIKTVFDKAYSEYIGEKIREQKRDRAMRGLPSGGGYRAFGYQPGGLELVPEEASLIREAVDRFVRGESVRSLCRDWNSRRITTTTGRQWGPNVMAAMLQNPRIAGLRAYRREIVASAVWPAIITESEHLDIRMVFDARRRRRGASLARRLLTGLIRCSKCGALMETGWSGPVRNYQCHAGPGKLGCGHTSIRAEQVEEYVVEDALRRAERLHRKPRPEYETQQSALTSLRTARETLAQLVVSRFVRKELTDDEYTTARLEMLREIEAAELHISLFRSPTPKTAASGLRKRWASLTLEERRSALADLIADITILPRTRMRGKIDFARVRVQYKLYDNAAARHEKARPEPARRTAQASPSRALTREQGGRNTTPTT